ncbi:MAG: CotH kinase family protein [Bacteroidales bacterium]
MGKVFFLYLIFSATSCITTFGQQADLISSTLPVVIINTSAGESIPDEPKIAAEMKIIHNGTGLTNNVADSGNIYSGRVGIEIRGRYSASLPQKPYGFETRDDAGNNLNVELLDMPEENDWVLTANYNDKSFLRNFLAFELFREMGHYAPRTVYCEVVLNGEYQGIYLLGEKIKQDKNRVDIGKLNPDENSGDDLTGGYIFVNDYYDGSNSWISYFSPLNRSGSDVYFVYYDPEPDDMTATQKNYLKDYVDSFERILYSPQFKDPGAGYRAYLDVNSFVDYFILGELSRNVDAYKKSRFYFKDKDSKNGLIHSGPPWDFDWAWKDIRENCINFNQTDGSGWAYRVNDCDNWPVPPSWEIRLLQDSEFAGRIHDRYFELRKTILSESSLNHAIDSVASLLDEAQERHFQRWKILGINVGTPEYGLQPATFSGEIEKFKNWIKKRLTWLDSNMVGKASSSGESKKAIYRVFPNPAADILYVEADTTLNRIEIFSLPGNKVLEINDINEYTASLNVSQFADGLYVIRIHLKSGEIVSQRFVKE